MKFYPKLIFEDLKENERVEIQKIRRIDLDVELGLSVRMCLISLVIFCWQLKVIKPITIELIEELLTPFRIGLPRQLWVGPVPVLSGR